MHKSIMLLLVVSTAILVDSQGRRRRGNMNNFMANRLLFDTDQECPFFGFRQGAAVTRAQVNRAFTISDCGLLHLSPSRSY